MTSKSRYIDDKIPVDFVNTDLFERIDYIEYLLTR